MDKKIDGLSSSLIFDAHKRLGLRVRVLSYSLNPIVKGKIFGRCYNLKGISNVTEDQKKNSRHFFEKIPAGCVIMLETGESKGVGHWGELMSHSALQQGVRGVIVSGGCRDIEEIKKMNFSVFCEYSSPFESGDKYCIGEYEIDIHLPGIDCSQVKIFHYHDFVFADEDGVVIIEESNVESVFDEAFRIRKNELKAIKDIHNGMLINEAFLTNNVV